MRRIRIMTHRRTMRLGMTAAALICATGLTAPVQAQEFDFSGQTIELIVPFGPGGGSSVHARLFAPLLEQELPGNPTIVIRNIEGGGSVRGINQFAQRAQPDGLTLASLGIGTYYAYMLGVPTVEYPLPDFIPILASPFGLLTYGRVDYGLTGDPVSDIQHLRDNPPVYVGDNPTGSDMPAVYCFDLLGIPVQAVWGVSRGESRQAFMRGESQVNLDNLASWESDLAPMIEDGIMVPIFTMGFLEESGEFGRDPTRPETPTCPELYELINGEPLTGVEREAYDAMYAVRMSVAKTFVLPPGTPDEIVATYQAAMERVIARPELEEPVAQLELGGYPQLTGQAAIDGHLTASVLSQEAERYLFDYLLDRWGVEL